MNKLRVIWKILTTKDWYVISGDPEYTRPFSLWLPDNIEVVYHD